MILLPETRWTYGVEFERQGGALSTITAWERHGTEPWGILWDAWFIGWRLDRFFDVRFPCGHRNRYGRAPA